jgi:plasmid stability protein
MAKLTVRNVDDEVVARLKHLAEEHDRSLEGEIRHILKEAAGRPTLREFQAIARKITAMTPPDRPQTDSTELIRADRDRDN